MADNKNTSDEPTKKKKRRGPYGRILHDDGHVQFMTDDLTESSITGPPTSSYHAAPRREQQQQQQQSVSAIHSQRNAANGSEDTVECSEVPAPEETDIETVLKTFLQDINPQSDNEEEADSETEINYVFDDTIVNEEEDEGEKSTQEEEPSEEENVDTQPLYPGASITVGALMLLLAIYTTSENITGEGLELLLKIIAFILPNGQRLCTTLYSFKNYFKNLKNPLVKHFYCSQCLMYVSPNSLTANTCPNDFCKKTLTKDTSGYFLEIPLQAQLQNFFSQKYFYGNLQERFSRKTQPGQYEDIYDGKLYKSYCENSGPLNSPDNISFLFNTDGAPVFKSSKMSIWPIFFIINELPYRLRMKKENMILAGLWFGSRKPLFGTFLKPFLKSLNTLNIGFPCKSPERGEFQCKAFLMAGTTDLPARSILCNSVQYNGAYSCWKCLQRGETAKVGKGHTHIFPFQEVNPKGPARTHANVVSDSKIAVELQKNSNQNVNQNGVKGPSWLLLVPKFDIVKGIAIDYMHGVLLGVQKLLLNLWFSQQHSSKAFSYHKMVGKVDERLVKIRPTLIITRLPRSIAQDLKYWKASEFRAFLLFYGAPVLFGILDTEHFKHYLLFVNAIHILLKSGSSEHAINKAEQALLAFVQSFGLLYDKCFMTLNIHQLLHLADSVRDLGPLYTHSCFSFEDKNGFVLKMIRGTQNIDSQILTGVSFIQKLPELKQSCVPEGSEIEALYKILESRNSVKRGHKIDKNKYVLGAIFRKKLKNDEYNAMSEFLGSCVLDDSVNSFSRAEINGFFVYGLEYARMIKRNNAVVKIYAGEGEQVADRYGIVRFFAEVTSDESTTYVAFVENLSFVNPASAKNSPIIQVARTETVSVIKLQAIIDSCLLITIQDTNLMYICEVPNRQESD